MSDVTLDAEIGFATRVRTVVSALPAFAVRGLTQLAELCLVVFNFSKVTTMLGVTVACGPVLTAVFVDFVVRVYEAEIERVFVAGSHSYSR